MAPRSRDRGGRGHRARGSTTRAEAGEEGGGGGGGGGGRFSAARAAIVHDVVAEAEDARLAFEDLRRHLLEEEDDVEAEGRLHDGRERAARRDRDGPPPR